MGPNVNLEMGSLKFKDLILKNYYSLLILEFVSIKRKDLTDYYIL